MHASAHPHAAHARRPLSPCLMTLKVDVDAVTELRRMVMRICGDSLDLMRIEGCEHGARMKVWLYLSAAMVAPVMEAVMRSLPGAEFGRFTRSTFPH